MDKLIKLSIVVNSTFGVKFRKREYYTDFSTENELLDIWEDEEKNFKSGRLSKDQLNKLIIDGMSNPKSVVIISYIKPDMIEEIKKQMIIKSERVLNEYKESIEKNLNLICEFKK